MENDIKLRQKKRELMKDMKDELSAFKEEFTNEDFKEDLDVGIP